MKDGSLVISFEVLEAGHSIQLELRIVQGLGALKGCPEHSFEFLVLMTCSGNSHF